MLFLMFYVFFGCGFYTGLAFKNPNMFIDSPKESLVSVVLINFVLWPIGLIGKLIESISENK